MLQDILLQCTSASVIISLIWAIALYFCIKSIFCYMSKKQQTKHEMAKEDRAHELSMKDKSFDQEQKWAQFEKLSASTDESLKKRIEEMEQSISSLNRQLKHEKENNDLNKKMLSYYEECFKQLKVQIVADKKEPTAENKQPEKNQPAAEKKDSAEDNEEKIEDNKE